MPLLVFEKEQSDVVIVKSMAVAAAAAVESLGAWRSVVLLHRFVLVVAGVSWSSQSCWAKEVVAAELASFAEECRLE